MLTIVIAVVHLTLETAVTLKFGQTFTGYLPDLIAVTLLLVGGYLTIKNPNAVGILCGAWGFACCLHYRSWTRRLSHACQNIDASEQKSFSLIAVSAGAVKYGNDMPLASR